MSRDLLSQLFRFGVVGTTAAIVNLVVLALIVELLHWPPLLANVLAFIAAYHVSFYGHHHWTFHQKDKIRQKKVAWAKFLVVAILSFILNEVLFFVFLHLVGLYYLLALFITLLIVPPATFVMSKMWAFRQDY